MTPESGSETLFKGTPTGGGARWRFKFLRPGKIKSTPSRIFFFKFIKSVIGTKTQKGNYARYVEIGAKFSLLLVAATQQ